MSEHVSLDALAGLVEDAFVFGFPALEMHRLRQNFLHSQPQHRKIPLNAFNHVRNLATPKSRGVTLPNNDTLYSSAWLELSTGPVVLSIPQIAPRYFSFAFMDFYTSVFATQNRRNAPHGGTFLVVGPDWVEPVRGDASVIRAPTNAVWLLGRVLVDGPGDVSAVRAIQEHTDLVPTGAPAPTRSDQAVDAINDSDIGRVITVLSAVLRENPPLARDSGPRQYLDAVRLLGPTPASWTALTKPRQAAFAAGISRARQRIRRDADALSQRRGWNRPPSAIGTFGTDYDLRAAVALAGIAALPVDEAMYFLARSDPDGEPLDGRNVYVLRFAPDQLPPVDAFWSLTLYEIDADGRGWLVPNALDRYSIGDRTPGLQWAADGSLEIRIGQNTPEHGANWLPAPASHFMLAFRAYEPRSPMRTGAFALPEILRHSNWE